MIRKAILILLVGPLIVLIVALAVANRGPVVLSVDPFGGTDRFLSVEMPLFLLLFATALVGIVAGGVATWLSQGKWRKAARRRGVEAARWREEARAARRDAERAAARQPQMPRLPDHAA